ncbi:MAG: hypothetical protein IKI29_02660 [Clostridia bacterium]|nr:hypothetical protein [Clostridia bacterium]
MNKKLLIGIIAGVVVLGIAVTVMIGFSTGLFTVKKGGGSNNGNIESSAQAGGSSDTPVTQVIEKGTVKIKPAEGKAEDKVSVPINLNDNPGIAAAQLYFQYDDTALVYEGYEEGDLFDEYTVEGAGGKVGCIISESDISKNVTANGTLLILQFSIKKDAAKGEYPIELTDNSMFADIDENTVLPKISTGFVKVR